MFEEDQSAIEGELDPEGPSAADLERFGDEWRACENCGEPFSDMSDVCPHCGQVGGAASGRAPMWIWIGAAGALIGFGLLVF